MFPTRVLLATDGSQDSANAARMAIGLCRQLDSELHVVYVGVLPGPYASPEAAVFDPEYRRRMREQADEEAKASLAEQVARLQEMGGEVAGSYERIGRPDAEIVHLAEEIGAHLIVMGSRGLGPLRRALMGSVSSSVVHHAHGSVLVVRGDVPERDYLPGPIVVGYDGSEEAERAARVAGEISAGTGSDLHLLYVVPAEAYMPRTGPYVWEDWKERLDEAKERARSYVDERAKQLRSEGVKVAEAHAIIGEPEDDIAALAQKLDAAMIVMGSRGLGGVRRALMGSVSDSVVRHARCPVLVVREE